MRILTATHLVLIAILLIPVTPTQAKHQIKGTSIDEPSRKSKLLFEIIRLCTDFLTAAPVTDNVEAWIKQNIGPKVDELMAEIASADNDHTLAHLSRIQKELEMKAGAILQLDSEQLKTQGRIKEAESEVTKLRKLTSDYNKQLQRQSNEIRTLRETQERVQLELKLLHDLINSTDIIDISVKIDNLKIILESLAPTAERFANLERSISTIDTRLKELEAGLQAALQELYRESTYLRSEIGKLIQEIGAINWTLAGVISQNVAQQEQIDKIDTRLRATEKKLEEQVDVEKTEGTSAQPKEDQKTIALPPPGYGEHPALNPDICTACRTDCNECFLESCFEFTEDCQDWMKDKCEDCDDCLREDCASHHQTWQAINLTSQKMWQPLSEFRRSLQGTGAICRQCIDDCRKCVRIQCRPTDKDCLNDNYEYCEECQDCLDDAC